jgi:hypothetical protein
MLLQMQHVNKTRIGDFAEAASVKFDPICLQGTLICKEKQWLRFVMAFWIKLDWSNGAALFISANIIILLLFTNEIKSLNFMKMK